VNAIATRPATSRAIVATVGYTLRSALPTKRWIGAVLPAALSILFGVLAANLDDARDAAFIGVAANALFTLILPVTCLVIGDAVLGAEVRSGTFTFTWMSPVPTWQIVIGRWLGGTLAAAGTLAVAFALAAVVANAPETAGAAVVSVAFGAGTYVAVFIAIGCITQRAAVWSLAFVFLFEYLLGTALAGIAQISPSWMARAAFVGLTDVRFDLEREGIPHGTGALVRLAVLTAIALALANWRLRHLRLTGSSD
jgi:ABC-type transport system involved in multi-copper enzyme maturation permease subunit